MASTGMVADPIALVEAAYDDAPGPEWARQLLERAMPLVPGAMHPGCYALDMSNPSAPKISATVVVGLPSDFAGQWLDALVRSDAAVHARAYARKVSTLSDQSGGRVASFGPVGELAERFGADAFYCAALDAEGRGLVISALLGRRLHLTRGMRARWSLLAAHVAAADRLRRNLTGEARDECVMSPGGRVAHAEGDATGQGARERLREAVVARDRARTRSVRANPDEALSLWRGLVAGRWSLLDRFESDGRRFVVARRNEPVPSNPLALTLRERQVLGHLVQGDAMKVAAYALGIDIAAVSAVAKSLLLKLGLRSVAELAHLVSPAAATSARETSR